tara:strand:- start:1022 stop:1213 length:192 start_codon:yes stop_codon:yes gene_type:complete
MLSKSAQKTAKHDQRRNFKKRIRVLGIQDLGEEDCGDAERENRSHYMRFFCRVAICASVKAVI